MGEAYHNNHHKNPPEVNFGFRWYEPDPTYHMIRLLNRLKIIQIRKQPVKAMAGLPIQ